MALTPEQQADLELQQAAEQIRRNFEKQREDAQHAHALELAAKNQEQQTALVIRQARIEAVRMAKETLIENRRNKPVGERDVTAEDITTFANTIVNYISQ